MPSYESPHPPMRRHRLDDGLRQLHEVGAGLCATCGLAHPVVVVLDRLLPVSRQEERPEREHYSHAGVHRERPSREAVGTHQVNGGLALGEIPICVRVLAPRLSQRVL